MSVNEKMTAIADEIRELSGTTEVMGLDSMASNISNANEEIANQEELLAAIASALEGKAAGGENEPDAYFAVELHKYTYDNTNSSSQLGDVLEVEFHPFKTGITWREYIYGSPYVPRIAVPDYGSGIDDPCPKFYDWYGEDNDPLVYYIHTPRVEVEGMYLDRGPLSKNGEDVLLDDIIQPYIVGSFETTKYCAPVTAY